MSLNRIYNINETKNISVVGATPSLGYTIMYPKMDNNWYSMGSNGIESRFGSDVLYGNGFNFIPGGYSPYSGLLSVDIGVGLTYSGTKINTIPLSLQNITDNGSITTNEIFSNEGFSTSWVNGYINTLSQYVSSEYKQFDMETRGDVNNYDE